MGIAEKKPGNAIRLAARIIGIILAVYFTFTTAANFIMGFGAWDKSAYIASAFILIFVAGVVTAWFREKIGGIMLVANAAASSIFSVIAGLVTEGFDLMDMIILAALPFLATGILFLVYCRKSSK